MSGATTRKWRVDLFGSPVRALATLLVAALGAWAGWHLWRWGVRDAVFRPDDLVENEILFVDGNNDNLLDDNEYFLFYSPGAHTWAAQGGMFRHRNNIYTDTAYYFVKVDARPGLRVPTRAAVPITGQPTSITNFTYRDFHEHDLVNLLHSGRNWVGEKFALNAQREFTFSNIPDLVPNTPTRVTASLVARSAAPRTS